MTERSTSSSLPTGLHDPGHGDTVIQVGAREGHSQQPVLWHPRHHRQVPPPSPPPAPGPGTPSVGQLSLPPSLGWAWPGASTLTWGCRGAGARLLVSPFQA